MITINFPNTSRSFDKSKNRICFWGYDKTIEVSFFVGVEVLQKIQKGVGSAESELLAVFDTALDMIHEVAAKVYATSSRGQGRYSYILIPKDF